MANATQASNAPTTNITSTVLRADAAAGVPGQTNLRADVVSAIVGVAVREVPGVYGLLAYGTGEAIVSMARSLGGDEKRDLGVRVELGTVECAIDIRIAVEYGASIPETAERLRDVVSRRVQSMCGLQVKELNIEVASLHFEETQVTPSARQLR